MLYYIEYGIIYIFNILNTIFNYCILYCKMREGCSCSCKQGVLTRDNLKSGLISVIRSHQLVKYTV